MADQILRLEEDRGIHRLVMDDGPNTLTPPMMESLSAALADLSERGAPPLVLSSAHDALFCPGWDLKLLGGARRPEVARFLDLFNRMILDLFSYPGPTAAAIDGHAVAGGCLLALSCDLRIMGAGRPRIGLSELNLGVPVPATSLLMLGARLAPNVVEDLVLGGDGCGAERACDVGLVHRVARSDEVLPKTVREVAKLAARPARAFAETKKLLFANVWARMAGSDAAADEVFLDCWFSDETQQRITGIIDRLGGSPKS
jgi:enoyl-CoA hydratase